MQQITYIRSSYDRRAGQWHRDTLATFAIDGVALRAVSGETARFHPGAIELYDPVHDEMLTLDDHGERWARLLPLAYAAGPIDVEVHEVPTGQPTPRPVRRPVRALSGPRP